MYILGCVLLWWILPKSSNPVCFKHLVGKKFNLGLLKNKNKAD